jgi:hypothetical protein
MSHHMEPNPFFLLVNTKLFRKAASAGLPLFKSANSEEYWTNWEREISPAVLKKAFVENICQTVS